MASDLSSDPAPRTVKLLIAADRLLIREGLKRFLAAPGMRVVGEASSADEVLDRARALDPDVLILDVLVGGPRTLGLVRELTRHQPAWRVLLFSVRGEDHDALHLLETGAAGYLSGDFSRHELLDAIRHVATGATYISPLLACTLMSVHHGTGPPHTTLSRREYEVLCLSGSGVSLREIASELGLSPKTVHTYRSRILVKLGVRNTAAIIRYAIEHGLVPASPTVVGPRRKTPPRDSASL